MDEIAFHAGKVHISLLTVTKLALAVASLLILALWLSNFIEKRLAEASGMDAGMRIGIAKFSRFLLLTFALLLSLYSAGIDLTALAYELCVSDSKRISLKKAREGIRKRVQESLLLSQQPRPSI